MLELKNISKDYIVADNKVHALIDVNIEFRKNEFVSILGPSGCGKTTLLNIIGGLDRYTNGDLIIKGKSTKQFKDSNWDSYRNHSVGFVFQSYNLIPHQTVLENVELALTLSGVSKKERQKRAINVLSQVGLGDKLKNKPNQLSGGQMQRVAIARALVNDPEIILADEPTGALDTTTSEQIMKILKKISKKKLVIMVTHNPDLAEKYSTRIINLLDGKLISDSKPIQPEEKIKEQKYFNRKKKQEKKPKNNKTKMSFFTALSLSFKNLLTKKGRTALVAIAGSIGIIGISLILSLSSGFNNYINKIQADTLSNYPIEISSSQYDISSLMKIFINNDEKVIEHGSDKVYTKNELTEMLSKFNASSSKNDVKSFYDYINQPENKAELEKYVSAIQYVYNANINTYLNSSYNGIIPTNITTIFSDTIKNYPLSHPLVTHDQILRYGLLNYMFGENTGYYKNEFWSEMIDNVDLLKAQYTLVGEGSRWAENFDEIMIVLDENNEISDYTLYGLGLLDQSKLESLMDDYINDRDTDNITKTYTFEELLSLEFKVILEGDLYEKSGDIYTSIKNNETKLENVFNNKSITLKVAGIIKENPDASAHGISTAVVYTSALTRFVIEHNNQTEVMLAQLASDDKDVLTGETFESEGKTKEQILKTLGYSKFDDPQEIKLYPVDFNAKNNISKFIENYNSKCVASGEDKKVITYSDNTGLIMNSISTIITSITYILVAFVGVSLVVSSIMIGVITYISVIERTKEIGILRSIGASKKDIRRVFNAESFIIGLSSGLFGILVSLLLLIPMNLILKHFTGISGIASLPVLAGFILVVISFILTVIAGFIPARIASKKDPVIALRTD